MLVLRVVLVLRVMLMLHVVLVVRVPVTLFIRWASFFFDFSLPPAGGTRLNCVPMIYSRH